MGWMIFAGFCMVAIIVLFGWLVFISSDYGKAFAKKHSKKVESKKQKKAKQQNSKKSTEKPKTEPKVETKKVEPVEKAKPIESKPKTEKVEAVEKTKPIESKPKVKKIRVIPIETKWEDVWTRTVSHQGEVFFTKMGIQFVYRLEGNESLIVSYPNDEDHILGKISKTQIENAFEIIKKCEGPTDLGPEYNFCSSYVYGILNDDRIIDYKD